MCEIDTKVISMIHVIYVAGVGHLLQVNTKQGLRFTQELQDAMLNHVLQICKSSPDITQILSRVCPWPGVPVPTESHMQLNEGAWLQLDTIS